MKTAKRTQNPSGTSNKRDPAGPSGKRVIYRWILFGLSVAAVSWVAAVNIGKLSSSDTIIDYRFIVYALIASACAYLSMFLIWTRLAAVFGLDAPVSRAGRAYFLSYLARYIPGKIGVFLMRAEIYGGSSNPAVITATGLEQLLVLAAAFLIVLFGILLDPEIFPLWMRLVSAAGLAGILLVLKPSTLRASTRLLERLIRRRIPVAETTFLSNAGLMLLYTIPSILHGISLFLVIRSVYPVPVSHIPAITSAYIGAILAGLFAIFIPGGMGIREGAIILFLSPLIPVEAAAVSAVVIRLVTIAAELCLAGGFSIPPPAGKELEGTAQRKGRLLYIVHEYPPILGGTGTYVSNLVDELAADIDITVITADISGKTTLEGTGPARVIRVGVPFRHREFHSATVPSMVVFVIKSIWHGWRECRRAGISGIHSFHIFPAGAAGALLSRITGIPCFTTAIGAEVYDPSSRGRIRSSGLYRRLIAVIMRNTGHLSAISTDIARRARDYHDTKEIAVLPPGIPDPGDVPAGEPHAGLRICSVSRLAPRKGLDTIISSMSHLRDIPLTYYAGGDGVMRDRLENLARDLGLEDRVVFAGVLTEKEKTDLLSDCDLFVLPSLHEGFGICYIEAMSAGLPVIASRTGGQTDFIEDGVNGILVDPGDHVELASAIRRLYDDRDKLASMGAENRKKARKYHTPRLKDLYLAHYGNIAGAGITSARCT